MLRRFLFTFLPILLLLFLYQLKTQTSATYLLGNFHIPAVFTASASTHDTTHLPHIKFIQAKPSVSPEVQAYLLKGIQYMYKFYITKFGYAFPEDFTVTIRIFSDLNDYKAYTSSVASISGTSHIGAYIHSIQEIAVWQGPNTNRFIKTVFHETNHLLLRSQAPFCPRWLNEGLSEYFEEIDFTRAVPVVHVQLKKDQWIKRSLQTGRLPALEDYLSWTNQQWTFKDNQSGACRAIAWSLVYYLMGSEHGQQMIKDLLEFYHNRPPGRSQSVRLVNTLAIMDAFAWDNPQMEVVFEKNWHIWAKKKRKEHLVTLQPLQQDYLTDIRKWFTLQWGEWMLSHHTISCMSCKKEFKI